MFKRRKRKEYKYINGTKGVISLFLCILMTPMLSIGGALIEFSRYQAAVQAAEELMDSSILSTLANYDKHIEERFGLFALTQDCDIANTYKNAYSSNAQILGQAIDAASSSDAHGTDPLSDLETLEQQIVDFGESTVLTQILLDDLKLQELLDKLEGITAMTNIFSGVSTAATLTKSVKKMVETGEALVTSLRDAQSTINTIPGKAQALSDSIIALYEKILNNEDVKNSTIAAVESKDEESDEGGAFDVSEDSSLKLVVENFIDDIEDIYNKANDLKSSLNSVASAVEGIPGKLSEFKTAFNEAKSALSSNKASNKERSDKVATDAESKSDLEKTNDATTDILEEIINQIDSVINEATTSLKEETINNLKDAVEIFKTDIKSGLGLKPSFSKDYYTFPLSEDAKSDLGKLLNSMPDTWVGDNAQWSQLRSTLEDIFLPDILKGNVFNNIISVLDGAIQNAKNKFVDKTKESLSAILESLVNSIQAMFDFEVFYNPSLCAYVTGGQDSNSEYQSFLEALKKVLEAKDKITSGNFFEIIEGIVKLLEAVGEAWNGIWLIIEHTIGQVKTFIGYIQDPEKLYRMLLIAGYASHNFPNRTLALDKDFAGDMSGYTVKLAGTSLTGYSYNDIKRPQVSFSGATQTGINGLINSMKSDINGQATHQTFMGAELEYVMAGTSSEIANQSIVFMQLYFMRLLLDLPSVFTDGAVNTMAAAATIASWVVYLLVILGEPLVDTIFLVNGGEAPLIKTRCYLTPVGIPSMVSELLSITVHNASLQESINNADLKGTLTNKISGVVDTSDMEAFDGDGELNMDYQTHCLIFMLAMVNSQLVLPRISNLIYYETRYHYQQTGAPYTFDMNKAYTSISAKTDVKFNTFLNIFQFNDDSLLRGSFEATRGY